MALRIEQTKHEEEKGRGPTTKPRHEEEDEEQEQEKGSPNDKVRASTGQPGPMAAVPLNQIPTPNQTVKLNVSHKSQAH